MRPWAVLVYKNAPAKAVELCSVMFVKMGYDKRPA